MRPSDGVRAAHTQQGPARWVNILDVVLQIRDRDEIAAVFYQCKKLLPFLFGEFPFGDVLRHDENGGASGVLHGVQKNLHVDGRSVLQAMMPLPGRFLAGRVALKNAKQPGDFIWRVKVADAHLQKLYTFIPIVAEGCIVNLLKLQASLFKYPHGKRIMREEE